MEAETLDCTMTAEPKNGEQVCCPFCHKPSPTWVIKGKGSVLSVKCKRCKKIFLAVV